MDIGFPVPAGQTLIDAQKIWKQKKDAGKRIVAVFLADLSGSMVGARIENLKAALESGCTAINPKNSIGLVVFSSDVRRGARPGALCPTAESALPQSRRRNVDQVAAHGDVWRNCGVAAHPGGRDQEGSTAKPMLFVLTDGETNEGRFEDMAPIVRGMRIPVHTIGFEADIKALCQVSNLVEGGEHQGRSTTSPMNRMLNSQM